MKTKQGGVIQADVQTILMGDATVKLVWFSPDASATPSQVRLRSSVLRVDPESGGASEKLIMPLEADSDGVGLFQIHNFGGESIVVRNSADDATIATIVAGDYGVVGCDGVKWRAVPPATSDFGGGGIQSDVVAESSAGVGVTVDGVLLKDGGAVLADGASIEVDTVNEATAAAGVTIDGLLIKDERIQPTGAGISSGDAGVTLKDNLANAWDFKEAANNYLSFTTTNDAERVTLGKLLAVPTQTIDMADAAVALVYGTAGAGEVKLTGQVLFVDPNSVGASEVLTLPPEATSAGVVLDIFNSGGEGIAVEDDAAGAVITIPTGKAGRVACDGTTWRGLLGA